MEEWGQLSHIPEVLSGSGEPHREPYRDPQGMEILKIPAATKPVVELISQKLPGIIAF